MAQGLHSTSKHTLLSRPTRLRAPTRSPQFQATACRERQTTARMASNPGAPTWRITRQTSSRAVDRFHNQRGGDEAWRGEWVRRASNDLIELMDPQWKRDATPLGPTLTRPWGRGALVGVALGADRAAQNSGNPKTATQMPTDNAKRKCLRQMSSEPPRPTAPSTAAPTPESGYKLGAGPRKRPEFDREAVPDQSVGQVRRSQNRPRRCPPAPGPPTAAGGHGMADSHPTRRSARTAPVLAEIVVLTARVRGGRPLWIENPDCDTGLGRPAAE